MELVLELGLASDLELAPGLELVVKLESALALELGLEELESDLVPQSGLVLGLGLELE